MRKILLALGLALIILAALAVTKPMIAKNQNSLLTTLVQSGNFAVLSAAIERTSLAKELDKGGPFTIFAPDDAAFVLLPKGQINRILKDDKSMSALVRFQVVSGALTSKQLMHLSTVKNLPGDQLSVESNGHKIVLAHKAEILSSTSCLNGVVYRVNRVLIPKEIE